MKKEMIRTPKYEMFVAVEHHKGYVVQASSGGKKARHFCDRDGCWLAAKDALTPMTLEEAEAAAERYQAKAMEEFRTWKLG